MERDSKPGNELSVNRAGLGSRRTRWLLVALPPTLALALVVFLPGSGSRSASFAAVAGSEIRAKPTSGYVGSAKCAICHAKISREYEQTDMARSVADVTPAFVRTLRLPALYVNPRDGRHYETYVRGGKLYQSEFQLDSSGKVIFRDTHELRWIIGAGASVYGGIITRGSYLFEAPMAFYTKTGTWGLEPGYEAHDIGFDRPILAGCIACHSGRTNPIPHTNAKYGTPVFSEMQIGCERCHGPGARHVAAMMNGTGSAGNGYDIVNPAHLTPTLANNLCESCHELGNERIALPGMRFEDYIPGTPLARTFSILMPPPNPAHPPQSDHLEQYYEMTLSKAYRATNGGLRCIDCHDPHFQPTTREAPAYYDRKCSTCHTHAQCTEPMAIRERTNPPNNCIECHMPKRPAVVIEHAALTDHLIPEQPGQPFPNAAYHQTTAALPDLVNLTPLPGRPGARPPLLTLLQAYGDLASYKPQYVQPYLRVLDQLSRSDSRSELVEAALGRRDLLAGKFQSAAAHLQRALAIGPPQAVVYGDLANAEYHLGKPQEAVALLRKGIDQDPYNPLLRKDLVRVLLVLKRSAEAQQSLDRYLQIFPQDASMRALLKKAAPAAQQP